MGHPPHLHAILGTEIQGTHILRPRLTFVLVPPQELRRPLGRHD